MKKCKCLTLLLALLILTGCALGPLSESGAASRVKQEATDTTYETKIISGITTYPDIFLVKPWEERSMVDRYSTLVFEDKEYFGADGFVLPDEAVLPDALASVTLIGYDDYAEESHDPHEAAATVYAIEGVDPLYALALCFEGSDERYVYRSHEYAAETLGGLIDGLALADHLTFGSIYQYGQINGNYRTIEFVGADADRLWELLFSDRTLTAIDDFDHPDVLSMSISVSAPLLGHSNQSLTVYESGYLWTNLIDTGIAFYIGEEAADRFMHYVKTDCKGYELVYQFPTDDDNSNDGDDRPVELTTQISLPQTAVENEP